MPTAPPIWRAELTTPEAMPDLVGSTALMAAPASDGIVSEMPAPSRRRNGHIAL